MSYTGKTQDHLPFYDTWKLREAQMKETTYIKTGPFAKHSIEKCKDYYTNNHVRACLRETMEQTII